MNKTIIGIAIFAIFFAACNSGSDTSADSQTKTSDTIQANNSAKTENTQDAAPLKDIVSSYLQIKNGLASDNGKDAASGGKSFVEAIANVDKTKFTDVQNKTYTNLASACINL